MRALPRKTVWDRLLLPTHPTDAPSADEECYHSRWSMLRKGARRRQHKDSTMVGIDVAKRTLSVCCWDPERDAPAWEAVYENSEAGVTQLLADTPAQEAWVLEPTGRYGDLAVQLAQTGGRLVLKAHTAAAKLYLRSLNARAKTDRVDARGLAQYGSHAKLLPYRLKEAPLEKLWQLLQVRAVAGQQLSVLRQQYQVLPLAAPFLELALEQKQAYVKALEEEIAKTGEELELFGRLDEIPGVGPMTAAALTVRLLNLQCPDYDAFVAYVGLDLRVGDSGEHHGPRRLTKHGDGVLRWLLYLAARANLTIRQENGFQRLYARKRAEGWTSTQALCMVARKLAKVAWALYHNGQHYQEARVFSQTRA